MNAELAGKTAIVTGAGSAKGIGRAIAVQLLARGANVVLCDLAGALDKEEIVSSLGENSARAMCCVADVTKSADAIAAVASAVERFGALDILVNNAGVGVGSPDFTELTDQDWSLSLTVNVVGMANFCQAAIPALRRSGGGAIVNIASLSGLKAIPSIPASYTASKFAAVGLTKQLALQLAPEGIRVNAVCPGSVRTDMMQQALANLAQEAGISQTEAEALEAETIAMGRAAEPSEIGAMVAALAGPSGSYVTGEAIDVSGGMFLGL
jgi:3-oxoacyl-[acyl-carrier protein] reductase